MILAWPRPDPSVVDQNSSALSSQPGRLSWRCLLCDLVVRGSRYEDGEDDGVGEGVAEGCYDAMM